MLENKILVEEIERLGMELPNMDKGNNLRRHINSKEITPSGLLEKMDNLIQMYWEFIHLEDRIENERDLPFISPSNIFDFPDYDTLLSLRVMDHDINGILTAFFGGVRQITSANTELELHGADGVKEVVNAESLFLGYDLLHQGLSFITFLASGNSSYSLSISNEDVRDMITYAKSRKQSRNLVTYDFRGDRPLRTEEFWSAYQLIKNASQNLNDYGIDGTIALSAEDITTDTGTYQRIDISDTGTGIPIEIMPMLMIKEKLLDLIIKTGNKNLGKTGLQLVALALKRRGGHAEIISTQEGMATYKFDTRNPDAIVQYAQQSKGTTIKLYFPT